jgi:hypothetical protein
MDVKELAKEVAARFDYTSIFNQIDQIAIALLKPKKLDHQKSLESTNL